MADTSSQPDYSVDPAKYVTTVGPNCEQAGRQEICNHVSWKTKDGTELRICQMTDTHLLNSERLVHDDLNNAYNLAYKDLSDEIGFGLEPPTPDSPRETYYEFKTWADAYINVCECSDSQNSISLRGGGRRSFSLSLPTGPRTKSVVGAVLSDMDRCSIHLIQWFFKVRGPKWEYLLMEIWHRGLEPKAPRVRVGEPDVLHDLLPPAPTGVDPS